MSTQPYDHQKVERAWREVWRTSKLYSIDLEHAQKPFYNLMMFPYPSAEGLHVGNMYAFTGSDIYGRFKRMQGYDVFEPMGLDGFGIHSENFALKIGRHPLDHAKITEKNYYNQLGSIGAMFDWDRTLETYDPGYYRWTQWLFIQMFKHDLAYRGKANVNWCPSDKTVLADEQVIDGKCERCGNIVEKRLLEQWFFRITEYAGKLLGNLSILDWSEKVKVAQVNWIGKKEGIVIHHKVEGSDIQMDAFSAFPAWLWADTFMVMAPDHPLVDVLIAGTKQEKEVKDYIAKWRQSKKSTSKKADEKEGVFTGRYAVDPFNQGARLPIWLANFALMDFGTGIIRCSSHDLRDFEFAKKYNIPLKEVVKRADPLSPVNAHTNEGILEHSGPFSDKNISDRLINEILDWIVKEKIGRRETAYHLRDWLVSRQRYWGPPIPMIYCSHCAEVHKGERKDLPGYYTVNEKDLPVMLPRIEDYKPGDDGIAPLAKHKEFYQVKCPGCGKEAVRETDVSDTFVDSSWYFLRYPSVDMRAGSVDNFEMPAEGARALARDRAARKIGNATSAPQTSLPWDPAITKKWLPVDMYTGGAEHSVLHLLYSRFVTMALKDWGFLSFEEPFTKFYAHGLVIKDGAKMSKSKGNVVNPDEYIKLYGSDALRLYLMFMGPFDQGGDFRDSSMEGMSRWVGRIWRMAVLSLDKRSMSSSATITSALQMAIKRVGDDIEKRRYNTAIAGMMEFTNLVADEGGELAIEDLKKFILILVPFAPHLTEELWQRIPRAGSVDNFEMPAEGARASARDRAARKIGNATSAPKFESVHVQLWPAYDESKIVQEDVTIAIQVNGKLRDTITVATNIASIQIDIETEAKKRENVQKYLAGKTIRKIIFMPGRLINFVI